MTAVGEVGVVTVGESFDTVGDDFMVVVGTVFITGVNGGMLVGIAVGYTTAVGAEPRASEILLLFEKSKEEEDKELGNTEVYNINIPTLVSNSINTNAQGLRIQPVVVIPRSIP